MRCLVLSVFLIQLYSSDGLPSPESVGAFAYQDSSGRRYGGTYGVKDGKLVGLSGDDPTTFGPEFLQGFNDIPDFRNLDFFFPKFFFNFENVLHEAFADHSKNQDTALNAARRAFDLTSDQAGYIPNFDFDYRFGGFPGFGVPNFGMPGFGDNGPFGFPSGPMGPNSAFAGAMAGPGINAHKISLNPENPQQPNIDVVHMSDTQPDNNRRFYSVSSSSFSSSSNVNGMPTSRQGGETIINDNGKVTMYKLNN